MYVKILWIQITLTLRGPMWALVTIKHGTFNNLLAALSALEGINNINIISG